MDEYDEELIKQIQNGNQMAFQQLMSKYGERVMMAAFGFTKNHQDAEDLYQETFIKVYKNIDSFRFESQFYTWVYRILANQAFNLYRKNKKTQTVDPGEDDYLWETIPSDESSLSDTNLYNSALKHQVDQALLQLSSKQRTVFIMKHYEGKKIKDIAAILELNEGTVKRYLFRATHKLRTIIADA